MSNTNSFKIVFKSEENEPVYISLDATKVEGLPKYVSSQMMPILLDINLQSDIGKITYPKGLPKNRVALIETLKGMVGHLEIPITESKVDIWEGSGGFGSKIDLDAFMSEEYLSQRGFNMESVKDLEVAEEIYHLMEDTKKRFAELRDKAESKILIPAFHYHSFASRKKDKS